MIIDQWMGKLWDLCLYGWSVASHAPTQFSYRHWIIFSGICLVIGFFSMRGFGSRKDY